MPDNLSNRGPDDRLRISMNEEHEIIYWTKKLGVSRDVLADAVVAVGTTARTVAAFLGRKFSV